MRWPRCGGSPPEPPVSSIIGPLVGQVQRPLQRREDLKQLGSKTVDLPDAVKDDVQAPGGQGTQVDGDLVPGRSSPGPGRCGPGRR